MRAPPVTRGTWRLLMCVWALLVAASLAFSVSQIRARNTELLREGARNIFRTIVAAREWNSRSAGVYAPVSGDLQPNPYLKHPGREITASDGTRLTLVNPAYMTRLIGEIISADTALRIRMPSLQPLNPQNAPDDWEAQALLALAQGSPEVTEWGLRADGSEEFRYVAPLKVVSSCLHCHAQQGYQIGDVRGGISISQPYAPAAANARKEIILSAWRHLLVFALFAGLSHILLKQLHKHWRELEQTLDSLVQTEKMASLGRLVTSFAHELNTPIGLAVNAAAKGEDCIDEIHRMLERERIPEQELRQHLESMQRHYHLALNNLRRAASLIQGFKRSSAGMEQEEARNFRLDELIDDVLQTLHARYRHCAEIEVLCPADLRITGIPGLLDQILTNLVLNSVQHGFEDGRRHGHIRIEVEPLGSSRLLISYADDGVGMSSEVLSRIFEPFFSTRRDSGGLGLYICYNLITTRLGGSIRGDSLPGGGTHFLITLPASLNAPKGQ
ncbi:DUF3365 domain-containing protein [Uliginosibacterium sp. 31-16]|uniref:sensor histidine kinase n=1 Tax=Uliginosibacterium sp. 31-16 TaxID=3068315 RepID=UPI00273ED395|nr:DUF3365 domain-containing protein [Uliginosibacterium sp. 31-16]MDP5239392.1 DUF3365 domain-containing protein [Uliginosibacterium sp. 31-16]